MGAAARRPTNIVFSIYVSGRSAIPPVALDTLDTVLVHVGDGDVEIVLSN